MVRPHAAILGFLELRCALPDGVATVAPLLPQELKDVGKHLAVLIQSFVKVEYALGDEEECCHGV